MTTACSPRAAASRARASRPGHDSSRYPLSEHRFSASSASRPACSHWPDARSSKHSSINASIAEVTAPPARPSRTTRRKRIPASGEPVHIDRGHPAPNDHRRVRLVMQVRDQRVETPQHRLLGSCRIGECAGADRQGRRQPGPGIGEHAGELFPLTVATGEEAAEQQRVQRLCHFGIDPGPPLPVPVDRRHQQPLRSLDVAVLVEPKAGVGDGRRKRAGHARVRRPGIVQQPGHVRQPARDVGVDVGGLGKPQAADRPIGAELGGSGQHRDGAGRVTLAQVRPGTTHQQCSDPLVGPDGRLGQMPRVVIAVLRIDLGEDQMRPPPLARGGQLHHRRARQRVPEGDPATPLEDDQSGPARRAPVAPPRRHRWPRPARRCSRCRPARPGAATRDRVPGAQ